MGVVLGACSADAVPTETAAGFAGISTSDPRDLPLNFESREDGRPGLNGGTVFDPISAPIDEGVAYLFDLGHCGLCRRSTSTAASGIRWTASLRRVRSSTSPAIPR